MRAALLVFMLSIPLVQLSAQQQAASATSAEESIPIEPIPQNFPCASQPRSLGELTASFNKGRAPSAPDLVGIWVEVGNLIAECGLIVTKPRLTSEVSTAQGLREERSSSLR
jgi:hypothetical protein